MMKEKLAETIRNTAGEVRRNFISFAEGSAKILGYTQALVDASIITEEEKASAYKMWYDMITK